MKTIKCGLALTAALVLGAGCFDVEQGVKLQPDMSGEASLRVEVDMEAMIKIMATLKRKFEDKEGDPTAEEMEQARKEYLEESKRDEEKDATEFAKKKKQLEEKLPQGVTLKTAEMTSEGFKKRVTMTFAFDHVSKLKDIEFPADEDEEMDGAGPGGPQEPLQRPFEGFEVKETAETVELKIKPANPAKEEKPEGEEGEGGQPDIPGLQEMVKAARSSLKVAFKIESPLEVVKHNATEQKGATLVWTYDLEKLEQLEKAAADAKPIEVTFKKVK